tara:strand:+ start:116 stop:502 length:387 start_codon:yes stop_codon:yes gene_type:complete
MITLTFNQLNSLNDSLQVGDDVYGVGVMTQFNGADQQATAIDTGVAQRIGILRKIEQNQLGSVHTLFVDNSMVVGAFVPTVDTFIMFSKASQGDSGLVGYYAEARLVNNSREKAELFSVGSEVIINSK